MKSITQPQVLSVDLLVTDAGTQNRLTTSEDAVEDYAELITESKEWPFGPLDVFFDGSTFFVADGFHRTLAAVKAKRSSVPCNVHKGTAKDARIFGMTANDRHGLRMSRADKRACVEWLLENEPKMTQAEIAEKSGVNIRTVKRYVADRKPSFLSAKGTLSPNFQGGGAKGKSSGGTSASSENTPASPGPSSGQAAETRAANSACGDEAESSPPRRETQSAVESSKLGKCPNCASTRWTKDRFGYTVCTKCNHPHGEPTGGADEDRVKTQAQKTVKTAEALVRAFDDLNMLKPNNVHDGSDPAMKDFEIDALVKRCGPIRATIGLIRMAKGW